MMDAQDRLDVATPDDAAAVTRLLEVCYVELLAAVYDPALLRAALPAMTVANPTLLRSGT